jgi:TIR domain-containing protein
VTVGGPAGAAAGAPPWRISGERTDFFVSHAGRDTAWAEWLAWQLEQAGYRVELDVWDWAPGEDFVARMEVALERADRPMGRRCALRSPIANNCCWPTAVGRAPAF